MTIDNKILEEMSNELTDMTINGASEDELEAAINRKIEMLKIELDEPVIEIVKLTKEKEEE